MCIENKNKTFGFGLVMIWDHSLTFTMASLHIYFSDFGFDLKSIQKYCNEMGKFKG